VDATRAREDSTENSSDAMINLFVHVGDFLSLSSMQNTCHPTWHSPRHRVLCPTRIASTAGNASSDSLCRRSLVYFAYPPPGVSLRDAQKVVGPLASPTSSNDSILPEHNSLNMYSVLHDQSVQAESLSNNAQQFSGLTAVETSYNKLLEISFDRVIARKWGQVQRK
jgi:hypothetical protein